MADSRMRQSTLKKSLEYLVVLESKEVFQERLRHVERTHNPGRKGLRWPNLGQWAKSERQPCDGLSPSE